MKVAILGANGFVGTRLLEVLHLGKVCEVRPVVRRFSALASIARFDLDWRVADGSDPAALSEALCGCDLVVNAVAGNPKDILLNAETLYPAAQRAGVKRIVHLSSASVHGQAPPPDTTEEAPIAETHQIDYNNAKVRAEKTLSAARASGTVELVMLRPSIVFGPRSRWVEGIADELISGKAALVEGGLGFCNTVYVDNLVQCVWLAAQTGSADGQTFFVGDEGSRTWRDYYAALALGIGGRIENVPSVPPPKPKRGGVGDLVEKARVTDQAQALLKFVPPTLKSIVKGAIRSAAPNPRKTWFPAAMRAPEPSLEMALLHQSGWQLSSAKAARILGYKPEVSFEEGMRRSIEWLKWKK